MVNNLNDIKSLFVPDMLGVSDDAPEGEKSEYVKLLESWDVKIHLRLMTLIGATAYEDAGAETPTDELRSLAVKEAEKEFFQISALELLWRQKAEGAERDIQMPSGFRITLQAFGSEDYERLIGNYLSNVNRLLADFICH